jgi:KDO2-lipid IV(A) lauroyltransferase
VPRRLFPLFAAPAGLLVYMTFPKSRRGMRENLRIVTGQHAVERLMMRTYYHYSLNWMDVMLMIRLRGERLFRLFGNRSSSKPLDDALTAGNGAILVSPHLGNWELGGLGMAERGHRLTVMTFREPDEKVNDQRERLRAERGIGVIYVNRNDTSPLAIIEAVNALRRNEIVVLLGERDGSSHTLRLDFFGRPADIPVGAAYLALASGAPVIPVFVPLEGDRYATYMDEPIYFRGTHGDRATVIREGLERLLRSFETYIRRYPDQWYNFFPYWCS